MNKILLLLSSLLIPMVMLAQTSTITATVIDPNGNVYANGTVSSFLQVATGQSPSIGGVPIRSLSTGPFNLNGSGFFSVVLNNNPSISPGGTTYNITVCGNQVNIGPISPSNPQPKVCFTVANVVVSANADISTTLNAQAAILGPAGPTTNWLNLGGFPASCGSNSPYVNTLSNVTNTCLPPESVSYTVATLPGSPVVNQIATVTDGSGFSCTIGGGSTRTLCQWTGSLWAILGGGGGGAPGGVSLDSQCNLSGTFANCTGLLVNQKGDQVFYGPNPGVDIRAFGARAFNPGSVPTATATCSNGSPNVSLSAASTFHNGDYVVIYGCGTSTVNTPAAPTVTPVKAASQTMTMYDVNDSGGGTQYCYQILSRTFLGGTSVSPETCTATGAAMLGLLTNTITSASLSNNLVTYTTSAAHTIKAGALVRIVNVATLEVPRDLSNFSSAYNGWFIVNTVPDNTHFTVNANYDSRAGATAVATGGTVNYWAGNHILAAATTNNFQYYVYGRVTGGTKTLIGIMQPQPFGTTCAALFPFGDAGSCLAFDDFGSGVLNATPAAPSYIPTTVPVAGTTNDMLLTKIVSGAGTTNIVVANNASASTTGTILFDAAQAFLATWTYAATTGTQGTIIIPSTGDALLVYPFNAPIQIGNIGTGRPNIQQSSDIFLNEPIVFSTFTKWSGVPGGTQQAGGFTQTIVPTIFFKNASPGMYIVNANSMYLSGVAMIENGPSSAVMLMQDLGGIPTSTFKEVSWGPRLGAALNHSDISAVFRNSGADFQFINNTMGTTQNGNTTGYADTTPVMFFDGTGNVKFDWLYLSGGGIATSLNGQGAGGYLKADNVYCQACYTPFFSFSFTQSDPIFGHISNLINDTGFDNVVVANFPGTPLFISGDTGFTNALVSGTGNPFPGYATNNIDVSGNPFPARSIAGNNGDYERGSRYLVNDGTFGLGILGVDRLNRSLQIGSGFSVFTGTAAYAQPSCVISAGGSVPVGTYYMTYAPIFSAPGSEGTMSQYCTVTTTGGNQTITATLPAAIAGSTLNTWFLSTTPPPGNMGICAQNSNAPLVMTTLCGGIGSASNSAAGGPAGITKDKVWGTNIYASTALQTGTGSNGCGTVTGCLAIGEASSVAPGAAGADTIRADSTAHGFKCTYNGGAEIPCGGGVYNIFGAIAAASVSGTNDFGITLVGTNNNFTGVDGTGTVSELRVTTAVNLAGTDSLAVTVYHGGAASSMTCTVAASTHSCSTTANSFAVADGDTLGLHTVCTGAGNCAAASFVSITTKVVNAN
jgi:hypothetical protein